MRKIRIGTSGWAYPEWRGDFYPRGLRKPLEYLAERVDSVEINGTFYSLRTPENYRNWAAQTPDDFVFAVKGPRLITHIRRLADVDEALDRFTKSLDLGHRQGPIIWQLPPTMRFDRAVLDTFLGRLPAGRHAVEARHESFRDDEFLRTLTNHNVANVIADSPGTFPCIDAITADFAYVRLHGNERLYLSSYSDTELDEWAAKIHDWTIDGYVYFDNTMAAAAPRNAMSLAQRLRARLPSGT
ncbi:hypothetical protein Lesp02_46170 [Lentzea sp. NBRC 105346]|uniref:DUF72 domain-containing protein n=1 Tax=Lentzea sp. NBRC 105346 TaxID=3032205 RepID=UPI0024A1B434|nr:DUF72 domain-containing protein [Lentzea sp. NBRC 105346]GLZ32429.1 hypothetical protein Lesp02_46170 [Lentzea sp. NBRC 105346]